MRTTIRPTRPTLTVGTLLALMAGPGVAQQPAGLMADLLRDVSQVQEKLVGLANAMPEANYGWRPGQGVRSVGEVFQHVAADNYLIPALLGTAPPASTGIKADNYKTVQDYETRKADRATIIADLEKSFAHLKKTMGETPAAKLGDEASFFGQKMTLQQAWILATTHLHEHLGQAIAYARSNGIVPPWSRSGN
ncbi:MAG TPA: DinB family protein [Gemmatimonadales bacterium]